MNALAETLTPHCTRCGARMEDRVGPGLCIGCLLGTALAEPEDEDPLLSPESLLQRSEFAGYELLNEIARGGMGVVFRARQRRPERLVALKVIAAGELASPRMVERFHAETEAAARLDHPNIAAVYEVGQQDGWHFFSMRLIDGPTLARRLDGKPLPPREAVLLFVKIARAVHHAHQRGVLHRDIKPNNILLDAQGEPYLTDFGLAKIMEVDSGMTHSNAVLGTPAYMPPEQALGKTRDVTVAADVYALGAVLYEMLTGQPPFSADSTPALLRKIVDDDPATPSARRKQVISHQSSVISGGRTDHRSLMTDHFLPSDLDVICLKALEKEPAHRYASASALADDAERWLRGEPIEAQAASRTERVRKWVRRHPARAGLVALAAGALLVITAGSLAFNVRLNRARLEAEHHASEARRELVSKHLADAARLMAAGDGFGGALALREALPPAAEDAPAQAGLRERLQFTFQLSPRLLRLRHVEGVPVRFEFSADGARLGIALREGGALDWDLPRDAISPRAARPAAPPAEVISPDGRWRLRHDAAGQSVVLQEAAPGRVVAAIPLGGGLHALNFHPDSASFAVGAFQSQAAVYDAATGQPRGPRIVHESGANQALFSPDGTLLVTAGFDYQLRIHLAAGQRLAAPVIRHSSLIEAVSFSPDGRFLAAGNLEGLVQVWDLRTSARQLLRNGEPLQRAVVPPAGNVAVVTGADGALHGSDIITGESPGAPLAVPAQIGQRLFDPTGRWLAVACRRDGVRIFDFPARRLHLEIKDGSKALTDVAYAVFSPDGHALVTTTPRGIMQRWSVADGRALGPEMVRDEETFLLYWSGDGRWISAGGGRSVQVWDAATGALLGVPLRVKEGEHIEECEFSPDGRHLLIVFSNEHIAPAAGRIYELPSLQPAGAPLRHGDGLRDAGYSPDGRLIATVGEDNVARLWHAADGSPAGPALRHSGIVRGIAFRRDGRVLATGSVDGMLRLWDTARGELMAPPLQFGSEITSIKFNAAGDHVLFSVAGSQTWVVPLSPAALPAAALALLAELQSGSSPGALEIRPAELAARFSGLTELAPALTAWPTDSARWHEERALLAERQGNWFAAVFHLERLAARQPDDAGIQKRLASAREKLR